MLRLPRAGRVRRTGGGSVKRCAGRACGRTAIATLAACVVAVLVVAGVEGCGKKNQSATHPDDMEGGSGVSPGPGSTPGDNNDPKTLPEHKEEGKRVRVWYGTNREPIDRGDLSKGFGPDRSAGGEVYFGTCVAFVPRSRPVGTLGSSWWGRLVKGEDDRIKLDLIEGLGEEAFYENVRARLAGAAEGERGVLVYVHGYKNSFGAAALRTAQLAVDLNVPGLTAFYSWPSRDAVSEYTADEAAVETAERPLTEFLTALATRTGCTRVHVIAHSMGNRLLARTIQRISADPSKLGGVKFGQIFLAAPDIDLSTFRDLAAAYPKLSDRTTLYISQKDRALEASVWTHSYHRAGYAPPVALVAGIDTIEVTNIDVSILGHGYVAEADRVLFDMAMLVRGDDPPARRPHLRAAETDTKERYWLLAPTD